MILTCPTCQTRYRTEAANFPGTGRRVRCAKCGQVWLQPAPETAADTALALATPVPAHVVPAPSTLSAARAAVRPSRSGSSRPISERLGLAAGWAGLLAMVALIGWVGFRFRQEISTLWPQSSALYATFGVAVNSHGIEFDDVSYHRETDNGVSALALTGKLVNVSRRELPVPPIRITLTDDEQHEIYHWNIPPPEPRLKPGQSLTFQSRLTGLPPGTPHLQLQFARQE